MKKVDSVISLVRSFSKSEKKYFYTNVLKDNPEKDYLIIYDIVANGKAENGKAVKEEFYNRRPKGSFEVSIQYLYERLLDALLALRKRKDSWYDLYTNICKARMLYERALFCECLEVLSETIEQAQHYQNNEALLVALKQQMEYLVRLNFPDTTEELLKEKQILLQQAWQKTLKITEHVSRYNMFKYHLFKQGAVPEDNELPIVEQLSGEEAALFSESIPENEFEITKNHLLFCANYQMNAGNYPMALELYKELNTLFDRNKEQWGNPPVNYISLLEEILVTLRKTGNYIEMPYFVEKIKGLLPNIFHEFEVNARCLAFQYELFPYLDKGEWDKCLKLMAVYQKPLYAAELWLNPVRKGELILYTCLVYLGNQDYKSAQKLILQADFDHNINYLPLIRIIRLVKLLVYYELGEQELVKDESRQIRRNITLKREKSFRTEHRVLWFINKRDMPVLKKDREALWRKLAVEFNELRNDPYENQILHIFDFTAWMEAKILRKSLQKVLQERFKKNN